MRTLALAAAALILASGASAQLRAKSAPSPWTAPFVATMFQKGTSGLGPALGNLGAFVDRQGARLPDFFKSRPYAMDRLAAQLDAPLADGSKLDPEKFHLLSLERRLELLSQAAAGAQAAAELDRIAFHSIMEKEGLTAHNVEAVLKRAARLLYGDVAYTDEASTRKMIQAVARIRQFKVKRAEALAAEFDRIPERIVRGDFDGKLIVPRDGRWGFADDQAPSFATAEEAYLARIRRAERMPDGPWETLILDAVSRSALADPGLAPEAAARIDVSAAHASRGLLMRHPQKPGEAPLGQYRPGQDQPVPSLREINRVLSLYDAGAEEARQGASDSYWTARALVEPKSARFPPLQVLLDLKKRYENAAERLAGLGFGGVMMAMTAQALLAGQEAALGVQVALLIFGAAAVFLGIWAQRRMTRASGKEGAAAAALVARVEKEVPAFRNR